MFTFILYKGGLCYGHMYHVLIAYIKIVPPSYLLILIILKSELKMIAAAESGG